MRRSILLRVLVLALGCLLATSAASQTCVPTAAEQEAVAAATAQEAAIAAALSLVPAQTGLPASLTRADLPRTRPSQPWPYRNISSALSAPAPTTDPTGVTRFFVQHAPVAKVTAKQLEWWFNQDLEKITRYTGDGKKYSLYLQWHPRDHCHSITTAVGPPANTTQGDTFLVQEYMNASRAFTRSSFSGFDALTEAQLNLNITFVSLNSSGLELQFKIAGIVATSIRHTWSNSKAGAVVTSAFQIGSDGVGAAVNKLINCAFSRGAEPLVVARKLQLHAVEEFGNFERILPGLYARRNTL